MEQEGGRPLGRFFTRWIYESGLPRLRASTVVDGRELVVRIAQQGEIFDVPVLVTLTYADGRVVDHVVNVTDAVVEQRLPLAGTLRRVAFNQDNATLGSIEER